MVMTMVKLYQALQRVKYGGSILLVSLCLTACQEQWQTATLHDVQQQVKNIRQQTPPALPPLPEFHAAPQYDYAAQGYRSPFLAASLAKEVRTTQKIQPNMQRVKQALEYFPLEQLLMKGTMQQGGRRVALIQAPDGRVELVAKGDYLGLHHGQVQHISAKHLDLVELISDGRSGYMQRHRQL
ncbi:MAG: pilus assembly protein PilP, partial [Acinetobacter sp.]|nr:pilus assembly protein PilP [Acinetobacter sp.]